MRIISFRGFSSEINAGRLDAIDPEVREREVIQTLKTCSWFELIVSLVVLVVIFAFAALFGLAIARGLRVPSMGPVAALSTVFMLVIISERKWRDQVRREFVARYGSHRNPA